MKNLVFALIMLGFSAAGIAADSGVIEQAVAHSARPDEDSARDENRKPAEVLAFFGIEPGMKVLDIFAGGGYYAEILNYVVGAEGSVTLYNNGGWDGFIGTDVEDRLENNRLANVESVVAEANETDFMPASFDAAIFILGFHDLYYAEESWPAIDASDFLAAIYDSIKPGGVLGIVDHAASSGVSTEVANTLHRIDPGIIRRDMVQAGFVFEAESDILRNSDDTLNLPMSDPSVRGNTDRVVYLFRKEVIQEVSTRVRTTCYADTDRQLRRRCR